MSADTRLIQTSVTDETVRLAAARDAGVLVRVRVAPSERSPIIDRDAINGAWIGRLCGQDWGLCHTVELNLARLEHELDELPPAATELELIRTRLWELQEAIERTPKTARWRIRARVGDRVRWYEEPEEVDKWAY